MYTRDGFSDHAQRAFAIATQQARKLGHPAIETGHILLGLVRQECFATTLLGDLLVDPASLQAEILRRMPRQTCTQSNACCEDSPVALQISALAKEERDRLRHTHVGTEHVLVALSVDTPGAGCAAAVLASLGLTPEKIRSKLVKLIGAPE